MRESAGDPGGGGRPPLILVPGLDGTALLFYRQAPRLERAFAVSTHPLPDDPAVTMDDLVDRLAATIEERAPEGVVLVGESFGGALSMSAALARPDLVRALVIVNSFPWLDQRWRLHLAPLLLRLVPWAAMPIVRTFTASRLHSRHTLPADLEQFHLRSRAIGRSGYLRRLEILRTYDIRSRLSSLTVPVLFLAGDEDRLLPSARWARYMAQRVPSADLTILEGYGHICLINHDLDLLDHVEPWWRAAVVGDRS
ncbi:MAG: alpha/beta hydrolase [Actinomycetota bacterium]